MAPARKFSFLVDSLLLVCRRLESQCRWLLNWRTELNWTEIVGYVASLLIAIALSMSSIARLRFLNLLGAAAFSVYGYLVGAYPVFVVNAYIVVINIVFLAKMQPGRSEAFELLASNRGENRYLQRFLDYHREDIGKFFPNFKAGTIGDSKIVLILRDMLPVGVVICEPTDEKTLTIKLDYVIPSHRDFRCAQYFYESWSDVISCEGVDRFAAKGDVDPHRSYLKKMGFRPEASMGEDWFFRPVSPAG